MIKFAELSLPPNVAAIALAQGFKRPTPIQSLVIPPALEGSDILGGAPTGTGKTAAFLLPILARLNLDPEKPGVRALILEPTRELALQVAADGERFCQSLRRATAAKIAQLDAGTWELSDDPETVASLDEKTEPELTDDVPQANQLADEAEAEEVAILARMQAVHEADLAGVLPRFGAYTIIGGEGRDVQQSAHGNIVCATPGRLNEFIDKGWFDPSTVELLIIDEADRMLDMGFKDEVATIVRAVQRRFQTMLFSATLDSPGVEEFARLVLNDPFEVRIGAGGTEDERLPELLSARAYYAATPQQKFNILAHLLKTAAGKAIIFVRTRERVGELCAFLRRQGLSSASLQGEMSITERKAALRRFKDNTVPILVATDVAARGLDVPDTAQVYNFDLPAKADVYVHRAGRTARAGSRGTVISLVERNELPLLERIERYTERPIERREIKYVCAAFPKEKTLPTKKEGRASLGGKGGFDKKRPTDKADKPKLKERWRNKKNKGKPDFAAKRAKKQARVAAKDKAAAGEAAGAAPES